MAQIPQVVRNTARTIAAVNPEDFAVDHMYPNLAAMDIKSAAVGTGSAGVNVGLSDRPPVGTSASSLAAESEPGSTLSLDAQMRAVGLGGRDSEQPAARASILHASDAGASSSTSGSSRGGGSSPRGADATGVGAATAAGAGTSTRPGLTTLASSAAASPAPIVPAPSSATVIDAGTVPSILQRMEAVERENAALKEQVQALVATNAELATRVDGYIAKLSDSESRMQQRIHVAEAKDAIFFDSIERSRASETRVSLLVQAVGDMQRHIQQQMMELQHLALATQQVQSLSHIHIGLSPLPAIGDAAAGAIASSEGVTMSPSGAQSAAQPALAVASAGFGAAMPNPADAPPAASAATLVPPAAAQPASGADDATAAAEGAPAALAVPHSTSSAVAHAPTSPKEQNAVADAAAGAAAATAISNSGPGAAAAQANPPPAVANAPPVPPPGLAAVSVPLLFNGAVAGNASIAAPSSASGVVFAQNLNINRNSAAGAAASASIPAYEHQWRMAAAGGGGGAGGPVSAAAMSIVGGGGGAGSEYGGRSLTAARLQGGNATNEHLMGGGVNVGLQGFNRDGSVAGSVSSGMAHPQLQQQQQQQQQQFQGSGYYGPGPGSARGGFAQQQQQQYGQMQPQMQQRQHLQQQQQQQQQWSGMRSNPPTVGPQSLAGSATGRGFAGSSVGGQAGAGIGGYAMGPQQQQQQQIHPQQNQMMMHAGGGFGPGAGMRRASSSAAGSAIQHTGMVMPNMPGFAHGVQEFDSSSAVSQQHHQQSQLQPQFQQQAAQMGFPSIDDDLDAASDGDESGVAPATFEFGTFVGGAHSSRSISGQTGSAAALALAAGIGGSGGSQSGININDISASDRDDGASGSVIGGGSNTAAEIAASVAEAALQRRHSHGVLRATSKEDRAGMSRREYRRALTENRINSLPPAAQEQIRMRGSSSHGAGPSSNSSSSRQPQQQNPQGMIGSYNMQSQQMQYPQDPQMQQQMQYPAYVHHPPQHQLQQQQRPAGQYEYALQQQQQQQLMMQQQHQRGFGQHQSSMHEYQQVPHHQNQQQHQADMMGAGSVTTGGTGSLGLGLGLGSLPPLPNVASHPLPDTLDLGLQFGHAAPAYGHVRTHGTPSSSAILPGMQGGGAGVGPMATISEQ